MSVIEEFEEILPKSAKMAFGGAQLAGSILGNISMVAITYYYNIILGLSAAWIAIGWVIFLVWNTLNDPIIGYLEDRIHSEKYGRRIPVIRFGAPFFAAAFILCWIPLVDLNDQFALAFPQPQQEIPVYIIGCLIHGIRRRLLGRLYRISGLLSFQQ